MQDLMFYTNKKLKIKKEKTQKQVKKYLVMEIYF